MMTEYDKAICRNLSNEINLPRVYDNYLNHREALIRRAAELLDTRKKWGRNDEWDIACDQWLRDAVINKEEYASNQRETTQVHGSGVSQKTSG
jgi:hypothetical protein